MADSLPTREDVMAAYGEAMLAVQQFEEAMVGLLGASGEVAAAQSDDVMTNLSTAQEQWEPLFTKPAGALCKLLGYKDPAADVRIAVDARNLLAHHYLRDHTEDLDSPKARGAMLDRLHDAAKRFRAIGADLTANAWRG